MEVTRELSLPAPPDEEETRVVFELEQDGDGTRLTVTEAPTAGWGLALEVQALALVAA